MIESRPSCRTGFRLAATPLLVVLATALAMVGLSAPAQAVVGGQQVPISPRYDYTVYLERTDGQFCGGSLISADKVLTAAHCVQFDEPSAVRVVGGRSNTQTAGGMEVGVTHIWVHPSWDVSNFDADLAILTLDQDLPYDTIELASNFDQNLYAAGTAARILGWGATCHGCPSSQHLRTAQLPVMADSECAKAYADFIPTTQVCAGHPQGGVGTCQGDSGGPLVAGGKLIGITSHGTGCAWAGKPPVYTQVSIFRLQIMWQLQN